MGGARTAPETDASMRGECDEEVAEYASGAGIQADEPAGT